MKFGQKTLFPLKEFEGKLTFQFDHLARFAVACNTTVDEARSDLEVYLKRNRSSLYTAARNYSLDHTYTVSIEWFLLDQYGIEREWFDKRRIIGVSGAIKAYFFECVATDNAPPDPIEVTILPTK